ncbi:kinase-like domain-containing protein [Dactylonectria estremocensis]|uniref:Autophagy-related protein 1 n=1 Tax=Dactylonectria estremocensis TaxID=1079267 RepID=A0A9P9FIY1_9HYPO|nr:kinase-like domain-containing protein [Dactylonectria estremocensis]
MANPTRLPELARDSELSTTFQSDLTIHTKPSSRRNAPKAEVWRQEKMLGHGGFGVVWLQRRISESPVAPQLRAVKQIQISDRNSGAKGYVRELEALAKFSQDRYKEFFITSYGWYEGSGYLYIAMEYCEYGNLRAYIKDFGHLSQDDQAQDIAAQVLGGLVMMHEVGFAHGDIKPENILIKSRPPEDEWWVKVCDLGLSRRTATVAGSTTVHGTPGFLPVEMTGFKGDPKKANPYLADMWCFGETIFQMLTGAPAFTNLGDLFNYSNKTTPFPSDPLKVANVSEGAMDFVRSLMKADPNERFTAAKAQDHPWMTSALEQYEISRESTSFEPHLHQESSPSTPVGQSTKASAAWTTVTDPSSSTTPSVSTHPDTIMLRSRRSAQSHISHEYTTAPSTVPDNATGSSRTDQETAKVNPQTIKPDSPTKAPERESDSSNLKIFTEETSVHSLDDLLGPRRSRKDDDRGVKRDSESGPSTSTNRSLDRKRYTLDPSKDAGEISVHHQDDELEPSRRSTINFYQRVRRDTESDRSTQRSISTALTVPNSHTSSVNELGKEKDGRKGPLGWIKSKYRKAKRNEELLKQASAAEAARQTSSSMLRENVRESDRPKAGRSSSSVRVFHTVHSLPV